MTATATIDTAAMTPTEIDTVLADLWRQTAAAQASLASLRTARAFVRHQAADDYRTAAIDAAEQRVADLRAEAAPYEAEYRRRPWRRYFLVLNSNGHVHRGMDCGTCYPTTEYGWLPELSGCDEAAMVDEFGEKACTVCFPDAPALPAFHGPGRRDAEAVAARAAAKAQRAADKAAKAITMPDGTPLRDDSGYRIATKVAARNELARLAAERVYYAGSDRDGERVAAMERIAYALEFVGIATEPVIERATKRAQKEMAR